MILFDLILTYNVLNIMKIDRIILEFSHIYPYLKFFLQKILSIFKTNCKNTVFQEKIAKIWTYGGCICNYICNSQQPYVQSQMQL